MNRQIWTIVMASGKTYEVYHRCRCLSDMIDDIMPDSTNLNKMNVLELVEPINGNRAVVINAAFISEIICNP